MAHGASYEICAFMSKVIRLKDDQPIIFFFFTLLALIHAVLVIHQVSLEVYVLCVHSAPSYMHSKKEDVIENVRTEKKLLNVNGSEDSESLQTKNKFQHAKKSIFLLFGHNSNSHSGNNLYGNQSVLRLVVLKIRCKHG